MKELEGSLRLKVDIFSEWPPCYHIKTNPRARRVILRIRPTVGLVITIPKGFDRRHLPGILEAHRSWIQETLAAVKERPQPGLPADILPEKIPLAAVDETWEVSYEDQPGAPWRPPGLRNPARTSGSVGTSPACRPAAACCDNGSTAEQNTDSRPGWKNSAEKPGFPIPSSPSAARKPVGEAIPAPA